MEVESLDLTEPSTAAEVLGLQRAAYQVEADLIGFAGIPPLHETLADLVAQPLHWLGIRDNGDAIVAALAFVRTSTTLEIDRLVVDPGHFRRGFGRRLVTSLDTTLPITVSTGADNVPAHEFYESLGFHRVGNDDLVEGVTITHFCKEAS